MNSFRFLFMLILKRFYLFAHVCFTRNLEKVNARWEVCVSLSEGQFQQVYFFFICLKLL